MHTGSGVGLCALLGIGNFLPIQSDNFWYIEAMVLHMAVYRFAALSGSQICMLVAVHAVMNAVNWIVLPPVGLHTCIYYVCTNMFV